MRVRVRVRSSKNDVRCASACETIIKVRVCVRHTVKFLATQHLIILLSSSRAFSLSTPTFSLSTPVENSEATWKKATKCNKGSLDFFLEEIQNYTTILQKGT